MSERCPSELALEKHLAHPARSSAAGHVAGCPRCQARLQQMRAEGAEFDSVVYPKTVDAVALRAVRKPRWMKLLWLAPAPILAAAALLIVVRPAQPPADYVGTKGVTLSLSVFAGDAAGARALDEGGKVLATSALRFRVRPSAACHLWIVSVDAAGEVARLFPTEGDTGALVSGTSPLPGGAVLDGKAGPERFFAVCAKPPVAFSAVERSAKALASRGPQALRETRSLEGLPEGVTQASLLLEKTP